VRRESPTEAAFTILEFEPKSSFLPNRAGWTRDISRKLEICRFPDLTGPTGISNISKEHNNMTGLDVQTARRLILFVAGIYILLTGAIELSRLAGALDSITAAELIRKLTTFGSLVVGTVIGFYLASRQRES
jgi:hypothetical protein